jgi:hypothetical protein
MAGPIVIGGSAQPTTSGIVAGRVELSYASDREQKLTLVYEDAPEQQVAVGGWASSARIGRPAVKWWQAPGDGTLTLNVAIDTRLVGGPDLARRLAVLAAMGQRVPGGKTPPTLRVTSTALPLADGIDWVMQSLTTGKPVEKAGELVRQSVTIGLEVFEAVVSIDEIKPGRTRDADGARRRRVIQSRPGDTLRTISVRQLGSVGEWRLIREWNTALAKVDPDAPLRTGTRVVLH